MTLKSMTGFGSGHAQNRELRVDIEISSVNRKQLDVMVNLPRPLQALESVAVEYVAPTISRGRIQVQVSVQALPGGVTQPIQLDKDLAKVCVKEMRRIAKALAISADISINDLIRIPGLLVIRDAGHDIKTVRPVMEAALKKALRSFTAMRKREGLSLAHDLASRIEALEKMTKTISARAPLLVGQYRESLRNRIEQIRESITISDERLEKEVILYADRADITEELTRLRSHFDQARGMFRRTEPSGRALDFLAQEMFREINTIGSKAGDTIVSTTVVHFKTDLERFREQVQNIE